MLFVLFQQSFAGRQPLRVPIGSGVLLQFFEVIWGLFVRVPKVPWYCHVDQTLIGRL
jgi:hypothetical protein